MKSGPVCSVLWVSTLPACSATKLSTNNCGRVCTRRSALGVSGGVSRRLQWCQWLTTSTTRTSLSCRSWSTQTCICWLTKVAPTSPAPSSWTTSQPFLTKTPPTMHLLFRMQKETLASKTTNLTASLATSAYSRLVSSKGFLFGIFPGKKIPSKKTTIQMRRKILKRNWTKKLRNLLICLVSCSKTKRRPSKTSKKDLYSLWIKRN